MGEDGLFNQAAKGKRASAWTPQAARPHEGHTSTLASRRQHRRLKGSDWSVATASRKGQL